jgi:hypothetical protein
MILKEDHTRNILGWTYFNLAEWIQMIFCQNQIKLHIYFRQVRKMHYV